MKRTSVGILIFEDVEVLDFAGPYEVFSRTRLQPGIESRRSEESAPFRVFTVAPTAGPLKATGGLQVIPDHSFAEVPPIDILLVPGGFGTRPLLEDAGVLDWIRRRGAEAQQVTSVCTGALLLAGAGLLEGRRATTHWGALDLLESMHPDVDRTMRVVEDGVITSAGVAAGIDMAFQVVERMFGAEVADETARYIEYRRNPPDGPTALHPLV
jgi:transcriptional regulator GlxA family with amidase domain